MIFSKIGKGILYPIIITSAAILFIAAGALTASDVPDQVKIENEGYKSDTRGAINLSHKKHSAEYNVACTECHHDYDKNKNNSWKEGDPVKKCIECHDPGKKKGNAHKLRTAYHNNCRVCHRESGKKGAPSKICDDCHPKK